jgi:hypothetical protein
MRDLHEEILMQSLENRCDEEKEEEEEKKNACDLVFPSFSICFFLFTIVLYSSIVLRIHFKP